MARFSALTPIFDPSKKRGAIHISSPAAQQGTQPDPPAPTWVRDDRYLGTFSYGSREIEDTGAIINLFNYANGLINNYGMYSTLVTLDRTGVLDELELPDQTTRRLWGALAGYGPYISVIANHYDNAEASNNCRLYDVSDPSNIELLNTGFVSQYGQSSLSSLGGSVLDPNNVLWYAGRSGVTDRISGKDWDSPATITYGPFSLSHTIVSPQHAIMKRTWTNDGTVHYGAVAGRTDLSIFTTTGIVGTCSLGIGPSSFLSSINFFSEELLLVCSFAEGVTPTMYGIDITNPAAPAVAWSYAPGYQASVQGRYDATTAIISGFPDNGWKWFDVTTQTVTHTLLYDVGNYTGGGRLLVDGTLAAGFGDEGPGVGVAFIDDPIRQPSPLPTPVPFPFPWREYVEPPATGLGTPVMKWDTRNYDGGDTLYNEGSGGSVFHLKIVDQGPGNAIYADKRVNFFTGQPNFGHNHTLPTWADFGGDWTHGPASAIWALPAGHLAFENTIGFIEWEMLPGNGGGLDFIGMQVLVGSYEFGFAGLEGATAGDSIEEGMFLSMDYDTPITEPLLNRDIDMLVVMYADSASRSYGFWVVDSVGVHEVVYADNQYPSSPDAVEEIFFIAQTHPAAEYDSMSTGTAADLFIEFAAGASPATPFTAWEGMVWAGLYRGRPSEAEMLALYASSF